MTGYTAQPGDIGLTQISGDAGLGIRLGQWLCGAGFENYEHAFVYTGDGMIVEAEPGGARLTALHYRDVYWCEGISYGLSDLQRQRICVRARALTGTPYSAADYFAIAAHRLHIPVPGLRAYVASSRHLICSQLADETYQGVRDIFTDHRWPGYVMPGSLYQQDLLLRARYALGA